MTTRLVNDHDARLISN